LYRFRIHADRTFSPMPKLSPLQWAILVVFLGFYGFAVFALTRDYYVRHPPRTAPAAPATVPDTQHPADAPTWLQRQMQGGGEAPGAAMAGDDPRLLNERGDVLFVEKRYAEAIPYYRRTLELDPDDVDAHNDLGLALHYTGQSQAAIEVLKRGVGKAPRFQRLWLTLGFVSAQAGDTTGARKALETARSLEPATPVAREAERLLGLLEGGP
jgi:predicted Zn-dependent protease